MEMAATGTAGFVPQSDESMLNGYLYKKTRDGRWQKRWFETNGVYLTYVSTSYRGVRCYWL